MFVELLKDFMGQKSGARIDVADADAETLLKTGTAKSVSGDPLGDIIGKSVGAAIEKVSASLQASVEKQLALFAEAQSKSRKNAVPAIFGDGGNGDPKRTFGHFLLAVRKNDQKSLEEMGSHFAEWGDGATRKAALNTQTGTQGGYTVPTDFHGQLMAVASEMSVVRQRATVLPMTSKVMQIPALDMTTAPSAGNTAFLGGLVARWTEESSSGSNIQETEPTFKGIEITAYELSGYSKISNALLADNAVGLEALLLNLFGKAIGWYEDYAFLRGDGAGKPLGILTWQGLISATRSAASAFALADAATMLSKLLPGWNSRSTCWVVHPTVLVKLFQMADAAGNVIFIDSARETPRMVLP